MPRPFGRAPDAISRIALKALEFPSVTRKVGKVRSASGRKPWDGTCSPAKRRSPRDGPSQSSHTLHSTHDSHL